MKKKSNFFLQLTKLQIEKNGNNTHTHTNKQLEFSQFVCMMSVHM